MLKFPPHFKDRLIHHSADTSLNLKPPPFSDKKKPVLRSSVGREIFNLRIFHGVTFEVISKEIFDYTGIKISLSTLHNWENKNINVTAISLSLLFDTFKKIAQNHPSVSLGYWMEKKEAKETVTYWLEFFEINVLSEITKIPKTTLYSWLTGNFRAERKKMETAQNIIFSFLDSLESS